VVHDHGDVSGIAGEPVLVVCQQGSPVRCPDRDARASIGSRGTLGVPLLLLEEEELAFRRLQEGLELFEGVDREQLEDGDERSDRHPFEDVHHVRVGGFRRQQVGREEVLELLRRHAAPVEVPVVEGDRVLDQVLELRAHLHPAGETVSAGVDDPDLAHRSRASSRTPRVSLSFGPVIGPLSAAHRCHDW